MNDYKKVFETHSTKQLNDQLIGEIINDVSRRGKYIIITNNDEAIAFLEKVNNGKRIIPTLVVDGKIYTNPGISGLIKIIE